MRLIKHLLVSTMVLTTVFCSIGSVTAQVPQEVSSIINMDLEAGQNKLKSLGYDICHSSFFEKEQDWYNETEKICVTIKFSKKSKVITEVLLNEDIPKCQEGLDASKKVWEKYHDGPAPVSTPKIDKERQKLADQGFKVSYWTDQISPGKSSEYWVNDSTQKTMLIVWEADSKEWVMTNKTDYEYGKNPAPTQP